MIELDVGKRIKAACPQLQLGLKRAEVINSDTCDELWAEIESAAADITSRYQLLEINQRPAIAVIRRLYRSLGKAAGLK